MYASHPSPYEQYTSVLAKRKFSTVNSPKIQDACKQLLKIKIMLEFNESDCWREFIVPAYTSLPVFHDRILSAVMGWARGYHGYVFEDHHDGSILGPKKYANYVDVQMWAKQNYNAYAEDRMFPLASILRDVGDTCKYTYDMGDKWSHILRVEQVLEPGVPGSYKAHEVVLLSGHGGCPPEDSMGMGCYGSYEYPQFLARYKKASPTAQRKMEAEITSKAMNYEPSEVPIPFHPINYNIAFCRALLKVHVESGENCLRNNDYIGVPWGGAGMDDSDSSWSKPCIMNHDKCGGCLSSLKVLMHCAKCKKVLYCSRECQAGDWKKHKRVCKPAQTEPTKN